ncbi:MAG: hypothetical protein IKS91_02960 [Spirochaetia bacterium]|nr:hypothetical protein [Spirochaetia bacterium]
MVKFEEIKKAPRLDTDRATSTIPSVSYLDKKSSIVSIIPDSIYHFKRKPGAASRFLLENVEGEFIVNFPSVYKRGSDAGLPYIGFRKMKDFHLKKWSHCLELEQARMFTGVNLVTGRDGVARGFGDNRNQGRRDCVLVQYSADGQNLDIAFVFGKADRAEEVYNAWIEDIERGQYYDGQ